MVFGSGTDLFIAECCNRNKASGSNLGGTFKSPENKEVELNTYLAGEDKFKVAEIEMY